MCETLVETARILAEFTRIVSLMTPKYTSILIVSM